jgi:hypothetical protein
MEDPHKKSKDEAINIALIHHHVNSNTPSGIKIREAFFNSFPVEPMFVSTVESGANRSTHHDLQIKFGDKPDDLKTVEFKGSKHFKSIDHTKHPWVNGVQFYNGTGSKFAIGHKYARDFYDTMLDEIIAHLQIQSPKPSYEIWAKDAFKQGKPSTPFVCELREKGYGGEYLSNIRKKFNKNFIAGDMDMMILMDEVQNIANSALSCKDYWLQIHGDIDNPDSFYVKWNDKIEMPQIQEIEQINSKGNCDINFKFVCVDGTEFSAKLRWGYGQCITNIRLDIK